jgi:hypothetical protein
LDAVWNNEENEKYFLSKHDVFRLAGWLLLSQAWFRIQPKDCVRCFDKQNVLSFHQDRQYNSRVNAISPTSAWVADE